VAAWALREDLAGFLERTQVPGWVPARLGIALGFGAAYVGVSNGLDWLSGRAPAWASAPVVLLLVAGANLALPPDYPGIHFFALACSARAGALGVSRALAGREISRRKLSAALSALGVASLASIGIRPPAAIWRRVFDVPCSVAPHLLGPVLSPSKRISAAWVPPESAAWFHDRSGLPPRPAFRRRIVPENAVVVVVTIDALRADVAQNGEHDDVLPELARVRDRAIRFVNARSPSPSTLTTTMAFFTGKYYSQTYWTKSGNSVLPSEDDSLRFPELLSQQGVRTVHAVSLRGLSKKTGVGRGFRRERQTKKDYGRAGDLMNIILHEVKALEDRPGFVYAHFVDSHAPYTLAGTEGTLFERYLGELALVDHELGRLTALLDRPELKSRAVLVVSADHGEAFGEHGMNYHARSVYEELLRVPMFVVMPEGKSRDVTVPVGLIDLGPTVLDLFGVGTPGDFMGESLVPLLAGETMKPTRVLAADSGRRIQALIFPDGVKVIRDLTHRTTEVYDLRRDPGELENVLGDESFPAERYVGALEAFFEMHTLSRKGWEPPWRKF
jgi:arylsulfatase A-like enzyme